MLKLNQNHLTILALSLAIVGCGGTGNPNIQNVPTPIKVDPRKGSYLPRVSQKPEHVLIYIDLTSSIRPESLEKIGDKLKAVLLKLPRGSRTSIRLVEKNLLGESPFESLESPGQCVVEESEIDRKRIEAQNECDKASEPYLKKTNEIVQRIKTLKPKVDVSCIMDTFESAHDFFKVKDPQHATFRLIYFSDMIEQCATNSIYVCSKKLQPKKDEIRSRVNMTFHPTFNLKSVIGENLSIIITASDNPGYMCLSLAEQKEIWSDVFGKIGYQRLEISDFNFTQEIPDVLKSP